MKTINEKTTAGFMVGGIFINSAYVDNCKLQQEIIDTLNKGFAQSSVYKMKNGVKLKHLFDLLRLTNIKHDKSVLLGTAIREQKNPDIINFLKQLDICANVPLFMITLQNEHSLLLEIKRALLQRLIERNEHGAMFCTGRRLIVLDGEVRPVCMSDIQSSNATAFEALRNLKQAMLPEGMMIFLRNDYMYFDEIKKLAEQCGIEVISAGDNDPSIQTYVNRIDDCYFIISNLKLFTLGVDAVIIGPTNEELSRDPYVFRAMAWSCTDGDTPNKLLIAKINQLNAELQKHLN